MEVRLANGARHPEPRRDEEQGGKRDPERSGDAEDDRGRRLNSGGDEEQRRSPLAPPSCDADDLVSGHRREGYGGRDHADDPHRIAIEQVEQIGLRRVERPAEEAKLESGSEHEQSKWPLPPAERDSCPRILRDLRWQLACGDGAGREADVVHHDERHDEDSDEQNRPNDVRDAEVDLPEKPTADRADEHRGARHLRASCEDAVEDAAIARRSQGVDEPRLHRARVEGEPERHEHRCECEREHPRSDLGEPDVGKRRQAEDGDAEQE